MLLTRPRRLAAEFLGTGLLVAIVVGSGIMAPNLTDDLAVALLINALATAVGLGVLIWTLGPISGAHFNPAVTLVAAVRREIAALEAVGYLIVQFAGAISGAVLANLMFGLPAVTMATRDRSGPGIWLGEVVATGGLLLVIGAVTRTGKSSIGALVVPGWIGAAYFFTASTSFANPAVTLGRAFSDTFAGIALASVGLFIAFQLVGAGIGGALTEVFYPRGSRAEPLDLPHAIHTDGTHVLTEEN